MEYVFQFQLSIFASIAIIMLLFKIYYREEVYSYSNRLFRSMIFSILILMLLESLSWIFDGRSGYTNYLLNYIFNFLLFVFSPVTVGFWVAYIHYKIYKNQDTLRKYLHFQYPVIISALLAIINIFYPIVFSVPRDTNLFTRLPLMAINFIMIYANVIYSIVITVKERHKINRAVIITVEIFVILPLVASIMQVLNYGLIIMYPVFALSVIVVYLFLETTSSAKDYLTGIYSRVKFDEYLKNKIEKDDEFSVIMLDLDDFKIFNDAYGHILGDQILIMFAEVITEVFGNRSLVARYGGDEFIVVVNTVYKEEIHLFNTKIRDHISKSDDEIFRQVKYSYGYSIRTKENKIGYDVLMRKSDNRMYENKSVNKNYKRRKDDIKTE